MDTKKRLRFEIFKRDGFRCVYCGASPLRSTLTVKLQVDHVDPKSLGGSNEAHNLVTACVDCNAGKSDIPLDDRKLKSGFASDEEREHAEQIREYLRVEQEIVKAKKESEAVVLEHWQERIGDWHPRLPRYIPGAVQEFGIARVAGAVDIVARKRIKSDIDQMMYFCGILRRWRERERATG